MNATQDIDHDHNPPVTSSSIILYALDYAQRQRVISLDEWMKARCTHNELVALAELVVKHHEGPTNSSPVPEAKRILATLEG